MGFSKEEIIRATGAQLLEDDGGACEFTISTDTRTISEGDLYLPLKGANFDGENFLTQAVEAGAAGVFVTKDEYPEGAKIVFKVQDTLKAYLELAKYYLAETRDKGSGISSLKTIAITGSSGKTTTKEMVFAVVGKKFKTHKTFSNHNNEVGLCQTILSMPKDTQVLILEMGMRGLGEIELLSKYSEPDLAIITNIGTAHIGRLGSIENIAKAKCEITKHLRGDLIACKDEKIKHPGIFYSIDDAKILEKREDYSKFIYKGNEYELNVAGDYNIENSLAAIEIGNKLGMSAQEIAAGLADYRPIEKRWEVQEIGKFKIINDSYNANPDSMKAAASTFIELYPSPVVILGDMGELGENEIELHREVGKYLAQKAKSASFVKFLTVGNLSKEIAKELEKSGVWVKSFEENSQAARYIVENPHIGNTIFLKASRSMKFEEIIEKLKS